MNWPDNLGPKLEQCNMMGSLFYCLIEHSTFILFIYDLFNNDVSSSDNTALDIIITSSKLERVWNEAIMA